MRVTVRVVCAIALVGIVLAVPIAAIMLSGGRSPTTPAPPEPVCSTSVRQGQTSFIVGPDLCNLTWAFKLNNTAYRQYKGDYAHYRYIGSSTTLYAANFTLTLREVGHTLANATQTIFIEPEIQPLGDLVQSGTCFQLLWRGNITSDVNNYGWYGGGIVPVPSNRVIWKFPTLTFNMPYYVEDTAIAGIQSFAIASTFEVIVS